MEKQRDAALLDLAGSQDKESGWPLTGEKGKEMDYFLELSERNPAPQPMLDF